MPIASILRRASGYFLPQQADAGEDALTGAGDDEVLFCKNNVCVHQRQQPPQCLQQANAVAFGDSTLHHHPGYLTITSKTFVDQYNEARRPTLFLNWIPNATLRKCPAELRKLPAEPPAKEEPEEMEVELDPSEAEELSRQESARSSTNPFLNGKCYEETPSESSAEDVSININVELANPEIEITSPEERPFSRSESVTSTDSNYSWMERSSTLAESDHFFPASSIQRSSQPERCRRFSVDLSQMRSLRLFFNDAHCTCGQLVIASRESQYKILHFHHGGLDHLAQVLHKWHCLLHSIKQGKGGDDNLPYKHFMVCRPEVSDLELHPEEGQVARLTEPMFRSLFNEHGQLEDDLALRKAVFFAGLERGLRKEVWPFLLHCYPYQSTYEERRHIAEVRRQEYEAITRRRLELAGPQLAAFRRRVQSVVEKDVVRTDRANPFFAGEHNPNVEVMKSILLNYAVYNPGLGYTQGMSDLLAPVLCELADEPAAFWCFVGLMQRAVFVATPTDRDMDRSLRYLRDLVGLMVPRFHKHLDKYADGSELLFCHRWILLCFKREFTEAVALRMWEACWANYLTDYFHLFLCLAIICVYADDVIAQDLRPDEMLLHFSSLALYMDGALIARKARGLLHQFRQLREIPCTLANLCSRCGPGIWDSSHSPRIYCSGHDSNGFCPNNFN